jgi:hypothetical protein
MFCSSPIKDIQLQTREGTAYIPRGAAAWIMETGNDAAIYDLHDSLLVQHGGPYRPQSWEPKE